MNGFLAKRPSTLWESVVRHAIPASHLKWPTRLARLGVAWVCVSVGIALMIQSDLGVAPIDSLIAGLAETTNVSIGLMFILVSITFFSLAAALGSYPGIGSVTGSVFIGPLIGWLLDSIEMASSLFSQMGYFIVGLILVAFGVCVAISTNLGAGPSEVLMLGLHHRGVPLVVARWLVDGVHLLGALIFGGPLGVGTIVFLVLMAPLVKAGLRLLRFETIAPLESA